jgi:hypothetical protein
MREFQGNYLRHVNSYTKVAYKDDPAVVGVLLTNENDLTEHFGNMMLPDKGHPAHNRLFNQELRDFAERTGLPAGRLGQTWLPGPSKLLLNDLEHRFNQMMREELRQIGMKAPVATTSYWGSESLFVLPALSDGDVIDVHSYGHAEALNVNPRYEANYIAWIGAAQVQDKPLTISEWNVEYPQVDRFTAPLYVASIASLQGWDAPMLFAYAQGALNNPGRPEKWAAVADPALLGVMPAAAVAYREGHVSPARKTYCLTLDRSSFFDRNVNPQTSATIRTLMEQSKLTIGLPDVPELPWLRPTHQPLPEGVEAVTDLDRDYIPADETTVSADTGEIRRDWAAGFQTIDTSRTQAVSGWIGGRSLDLGDSSFQIDNPKAVVALSSIDGEPLKSSRFVLVTAVARVLPSKSPKKKDLDVLPMRSEPVKGSIRLRTQVKGLQLLALGSDGHVVGRRSLETTPDGVVFQIPTDRGTHWYVLQADGGVPRKRTP